MDAALMDGQNLELGGVTGVGKRLIYHINRLFSTLLRGRSQTKLTRQGRQVVMKISTVVCRFSLVTLKKCLHQCQPGWSKMGKVLSTQLKNDPLLLPFAPTINYLSCCKQFLLYLLEILNSFFYHFLFLFSERRFFSPFLVV